MAEWTGDGNADREGKSGGEWGWMKDILLDGWLYTPSVVLFVGVSLGMLGVLLRETRYIFTLYLVFMVQTPYQIWCRHGVLSLPGREVWAGGPLQGGKQGV